MKRIKALNISLTLLFLAMTCIAIEQTTGAQGGWVGCMDTPCGGTATCGELGGTVSGCTITCANGASITCRKADEND
jgi:hypothetical protein